MKEEKQLNPPPCKPEERHLTPPMLINQISRLFDEQMRAVTPPGIQSQNSTRFIMGFLAHHDGSSQQELVESTKMKAPTISLALKRMEKDGIVCRKPDENDLRCVRVFLTEKGRQLDLEIHGMLHDLDARLMQGVTPEEEEALTRILLQMRENIRPGNGKKDSKEEN